MFILARVTLIPLPDNRIPEDLLVKFLVTCVVKSEGVSIFYIKKIKNYDFYRVLFTDDKSR